MSVEAEAIQIMADHMPTYADCYNAPFARLPSPDRLRNEARQIAAALEAAGFEIVRKVAR